MPLFDADIAEIVRSQKKDDEYIDQFTNSLRVLAQRVLGPRRYVRLERELTLFGPLAYYTVTTLAGLQTLGEEYVGLIETIRSPSNLRAIPSLFRRLVFIFLQVSGPYLSDVLLAKLRRTVASNPVDNNQQFLLRLIDSVRRDFIPGLQRLHLAIFYIAGGYYHVSKRICGVTYSSVRASGPIWNTLPLFRYLGYFSIFQIVFSAALWLYSELNVLRSRQRFKGDIGSSKSIEGVYSANFRCQLCLDEGKPLACPPCGHPFCWDCLLEHVTEYHNCPLCRIDVGPSRIIPLLNA